MRNTSFRCLLTIVMCGGLLVGSGSPPADPPSSPLPIRAYVEPSLQSGGPAERSVIVSAADTSDARAAVERAGGRITSELWLINAVAANIPQEGIAALAADPGIQSVVANKGVRSAGWDGWMTQQRVVKASYSLPENQLNPVAYLSDGAFVTVGEKGLVVIVNADGTERAQFRLPNGPFKTPTVVVAGDNTIFVASESKSIYAIRPDGTIRWHFRDDNGAKFIAGLAVAPGVVYAADDRGLVYAIDAATGARRWSFNASATGTIAAMPAVTPTGMLLFASEKGAVYALDAAGRQLWAARLGIPVVLNPILTPDARTLYIASTDDKLVVALDTASGAERYRFAAPSKIIGAPTLGPDGSLYIPTEGAALYGLNADGTQRFAFRPGSGKFKTAATLSADGTTLYAAIEERTLFAIDTRTGAERWRYVTLGTIRAGPSVDVDGGVIIGSEGKDLVRLSAAGQVTFSMLVPDRISQSPRSERHGSTTVRFGTTGFVTISRLPEVWDGRPDVQPGGSKREWKLVNPVSVDVGADALHTTTLPSGAAINGSGVTVAVVDSGVYFDREVKTELGPVLQKQFRGQIDFAEPVCPTVVINGKLTATGTQRDGYCEQTAAYSADPYGHGTAVASVVWNNFTDYDTRASLGVAPGANILSVRVLDGNGAGSYETVIKGIQYVVQNRALHNIRVLNLSLSGQATTPYFVDPLNRAAEAAWASGIVVLAAAGNSGPGAETVTVPGNDPYVITVGAVSSNRTPGYWADDYLPTWSATGPTADGFAKPDILAPGANVVTFMHNAGSGDPATQKIVTLHPDYSATASLFRMNGTSISTSVASGVVALMVQARPELTPDEVKGRLLESARPAVADGGQLLYSPLQQGRGRVWAPDAVLGTFSPDDRANSGMDIVQDLANGYLTEQELGYHYQGPVRRALSDDGQTYLYYVEADAGNTIGIGASQADSLAWVDRAALAAGRMTWSVGRMTWSVGMPWEGGASQAAGRMTWSVGRMTWSVGRMTWSVGRMTWSVGRMTWSVGRMTWSVSTTWSSGSDTYASARDSWASSSSLQGSVVSSTTWVDGE